MNACKQKLYPFNEASTEQGVQVYMTEKDAENVKDALRYMIDFVHTRGIPVSAVEHMHRATELEEALAHVLNPEDDT